MTAHRIVIYGNAGSGKTTMARKLAREFQLAHLSLDDICWADVGVRLPLPDSIAALHAFLSAHAEWVVDGCYGDLVEAALPHCSELRFLNPGLEVCVRNCRSRPWEPSYCSSPEEQQRLLEPLIAFVRDYDVRTDEFSLARHRALFDSFPGSKQEFREQFSA
ncbi:MAG TPA: hypothetical protein VK137_18610 [Planctomycetaceae bacterium]|nr:hypothetical protein [Planctomycetaceae bacterium]